MPGPVCCLLGACCPIERQIQMYKDELIADGMNEPTAQMAAECLAPLIRAAARKMGLKFTAEAGEGDVSGSGGGDDEDSDQGTPV